MLHKSTAHISVRGKREMPRQFSSAKRERKKEAQWPNRAEGELRKKNITGLELIDRAHSIIA